MGSNHLKLKFWGCRGTYPVPGRRSVRYGGNTPCVTLTFPDDRLFIFDAGTGLNELSARLLADGARGIDAKMLISHPHWDHIHAFPFFGPFYRRGHRFEIVGARQGRRSTAEWMQSQMDGVYFPITSAELEADLIFRDLQEGAHDIDGVSVRAMLLRHPGACLGYRIDHGERTICYVTDNELKPLADHPEEKGYRERLASFVEGADALITDCTYLDDEYGARIGWGHSCVSEVADLAARASVKSLFLFHHDPAQCDDDIDRKLEAMQAAVKRLDSPVDCFAPAEGHEVLLSTSGVRA